MSKKPHIERRQYVVGDMIFPDLVSLAKAAGISYAAAVKRKDRGCSDYEIYHGRQRVKKLGTVSPSERSDRHSVYVNGERYKNLREAYDNLRPKAKLNAVRQRLLNGWSLEEALEIVEKVDGRTLRIHHKRGPIERNRNYMVDGAIYDSIADLARAHGLRYSLVYDRIKVYGWSAEKAVRGIVWEPVVVGGRKFKSAMNAWDEIGKTSFMTFQGRKNLGYSLAICLGLEPLPKVDRYVVYGKSYPSLEAVADEFGLSVGQLSNRVNSMTIEEAVEHNPRTGKYSTKRFQEDPELGASIGVLYLVRIEIDGTLLHKIGITKKSIKSRFRGYAFTEIACRRDTLENLYDAEQMIVDRYADYLFRADESFDGKTETFILNSQQEEEMSRWILNRDGL